VIVRWRSQKWLLFFIGEKMSFVQFMKIKYYSDIYKKAPDVAKKYLNNEWDNNVFVGDVVRDDFQSVKEGLIGEMKLEDIEFLYKWSIGEEKLMFMRLRDAKKVF